MLGQALNLQQDWVRTFKSEILYVGQGNDSEIPLFQPSKIKTISQLRTIFARL